MQSRRALAEHLQDWCIHAHTSGERNKQRAMAVKAQTTLLGLLVSTRKGNLVKNATVGKILMDATMAYELVEIATVASNLSRPQFPQQRARMMLSMCTQMYASWMGRSAESIVTDCGLAMDALTKQPLAQVLLQTHGDVEIRVVVGDVHLEPSGDWPEAAALRFANSSELSRLLMCSRFLET